MNISKFMRYMIKLVVTFNALNSKQNFSERFTFTFCDDEGEGIVYACD